MTPAISAVLLAAGYGTRLYPLTQDCPKALLPVGDRVILDWIVQAVEAVPGLANTVLVTNHRFADQFQAWQQRQSFRRALELVDNGTSTPETRLGAIRDLLLALDRVDRAHDVLVVGTDNLFAWPLLTFVAFAAAQRPSATVAVRQAGSLQEASRCGVVEMDRAARIVHCHEKPAQPPSLTVALCIYYFPARIRERLQEFVHAGENADAPGYFISWLVEREPVFGFMAEGAWFDIGSQEAYDQAVQYWTTQRS